MEAMAVDEAEWQKGQTAVRSFAQQVVSYQPQKKSKGPATHTSSDAVTSTKAPIDDTSSNTGLIAPPGNRMLDLPVLETPIVLFRTSCALSSLAAKRLDTHTIHPSTSVSIRSSML